MAEYRLYFMSDDGQVRHGVDLDCYDDDHAIAIVEARRETEPVELWQRSRRVRVFPAASGGDG